MLVEFQYDRSGEIFSKQLIDISNDKTPVDILTGLTFPGNFCQFTESKTENIRKIFPNFAQNYRYHFWLSERATQVLAAKKLDVNEIKFQIQNKISGELEKY